MAHGNRGIGLHAYAGLLYDQGHAAVLALAAYDAYSAATDPTAVYDSLGYESAHKVFEERRDWLAAHLDVESLRRSLAAQDYGLGGSAAERALPRAGACARRCSSTR